MKTQKFSVLAMIVFMAIAFVFAGCHKTPINPGSEPTVTTGNASKITKNSAVLSGTVVDNGGQQVTEEGFYFSSNGSPTDQSPKIIGQGTAFTCNVESLQMNTTYYYMAYATNKLGTSYGSVKTFTTNNRDAALTITGDSLLTMTSVTIKVSIDPYGSTITEAGICYGASHNPTTSDGKVAANSQSGDMRVSLTGLESNTHYYIRAYAVTSSGTLYSPEYTAWTYAVMDYDGNGYHAITIGGQTFTLENYKCTHYNNGDLIPNIKRDSLWSDNSGIGLTTGARCYYNNDSSRYDSTYGCLYNQYAVTNSKGFAPKGWRLPTGSEIATLAVYLGGNQTSAGKLRETGTNHWKAPNAGATNSSGFTALPNGDRGDTYQGGIGTFNDLTIDATWWEQGEYSPTVGWAFYVEYNSTVIQCQVAVSKSYGYGVRFIKK